MSSSGITGSSDGSYRSPKRNGLDSDLSWKEHVEYGLLNAALGALFTASIVGIFICGLRNLGHAPGVFVTFASGGVALYGLARFSSGISECFTGINQAITQVRKHMDDSKPVTDTTRTATKARRDEEKQYTNLHTGG